MLTANLFAKSSTIFYQQQCCLKTATIACFFSKKQAIVAWLYQLLVAGDRSGVECGEFSAQVAVVAGNGDHCGVICGKF